MVDSPNVTPESLPTLASVVFARIVEFTRRPVAEQARLRAQLEAALAVTLASVARRNRLMLDAPDGIAIAVLANPVAALDIAERCLNASVAGVPLAIAINHGAIRMAADPSGRQGLIGDALGTASAIAHFAGPSRLFVSRAFRDALAAASPSRAVTLRPAGIFTDANVRTHELLAVDLRALTKRRRNLVIVGLAALIAIVVATVHFRPAVQRALYAGKPAILAFDVFPEGEVFVDRIARGKTPPLKMLELEPGPHNVELRRKNLPGLRTVVDLEPGRTTTLEIAFPPDEGHGFFHRLRNWLTR